MERGAPEQHRPGPAGRDRHRRNARTLAGHDPIVYTQQIVGDYVLNGTVPVLSLSSGVSG